MNQAGIFEVKNKLSEFCEDVASRGDPLVVTRHGKPLVKIVPYTEEEKSSSVWDSVGECQTKYGSLQDDFELPPRNPASNRQDPLN